MKKTLQILLFVLILVNFSFAQDQILTEDFENGGSIPTGWTTQQVSGSSTWIFRNGGENGSPTSAHTGSYNGYLKSSSYGSTSTAKLISPAIDLSTPGKKYKLTFWHYTSAIDYDFPYYYDYIKVYYKTSPSGSWVELTSIIGVSYNVNWTKVTIDLPNGSNQYYIAFEGISDYNCWGISLDDVSITSYVESTATMPSSGNGTSDSPYQITNLENLYWISSNSANWDKHYIQTADIDASSSQNWFDGWVPIGINTTKFTGSYDGQGYSISGIFKDNPKNRFTGLFAYTAGATIKNLYIINANFSGYDCIGVLIGVASANTYVENCHSSGSISSIHWDTGGLIGQNDNSKVLKSSSSADVFTIGNYFAGGLVGNNKNNSLIDRCFATGNIKGSMSNTSHIGGLAGSNSSSTILNSYCTGDVEGRYWVGGFVGVNSSGTITNSYSSSKVTSTTTPRGGFSGYFASSTEEGCFWDTQTSGLSTTVGTALGKTSVEMKTKSTFTDSDWDFVGEITNGDNDYWNINSSINEGYPYFATEQVQPTDLTFSFTGTNPYNIILNLTASPTADGHIVIRKTSEEPTDIPMNGTEYSAGNALGESYILYLGNQTTITESNVLTNTTYNYVIYSYTGSGSEIKYNKINPLKGNTKINSSNNSLFNSTTSVSAGFPDQGVNITFPDGTTSSTLTLTKTTSAPSANFQGNAGVRGMSPIYFTITSDNQSPGNYIIVLDFSSLGLTQAKWERFVIMKRATSGDVWKNITGSPHNATIVSRNTDGVWGKFTISGLSSFSEFGGGEGAFTVTSAANDGENTLRYFNNSTEVTDGDVIEFDVTSMTTNTITLTDTLLISKNLTLVGLGSDGGIILNGNNATKVLQIGETLNEPLYPTVTLKNIKITGGNDTEDQVAGIDNYGDLTLLNCVVYDNSETGYIIREGSELGGVGGIISNGNLTLINTTVTNNTGCSEYDGIGGLYCYGDLTLKNSIIYGNTGDYKNIDNSINVYSYNSLFEESYNTLTEDARNYFEHNAENIFESNPNFVDSANSAVHPYSISGSSPCRDAGDNTYNDLTTDIKGSVRKLDSDGNIGGTIDIGAYEYDNNTPLPVQLKNFYLNVKNNKIEIYWQTASELNNYGFEIERAQLTGQSKQEFTKIGAVSGSGNSNKVIDYSFIDDKPLLGKSSYRLKQIDNDGKITYSNSIETEYNNITTFSLSQNFPNPFNPTTTITYTVPKPSTVTLKIFNILGAEITTLINGKQDIGIYTIKFDASKLASGIYFYRLETEGFVATKKMILAK